MRRNNEEKNTYDVCRGCRESSLGGVDGTREMRLARALEREESLLDFSSVTHYGEPLQALKNGSGIAVPAGE